MKNIVLNINEFPPPDSPNWHLVCPPGAGLPACRGEAPVFPVPLAVLRAAFFEVASAEPRVALVADAPTENRYAFIQKTALLRFVDDITVEFVEAGEGASSLFLLSRSRVGRWDLGTNRRRVARWLDALTKRLRKQATPGA